MSSANYMIVKSSLKCDCEPYEDVKTYKAWQAEGEQVAKGSKGIDVLTYVKVEKKNDQGEVVEEYTRPWHAYVFCRHQLESFKKTGKVAEAKPKPQPDEMYPVADYVMQ